MPSLQRTKKGFPWRFVRRIVLLLLLAWVLVIIGLVFLIDRTGQVDQRQPADVIVVLGAGLSRDGRPGYALVRRSRYAADLWQQGYADTILCTGGQAPGQSRSEADACREVLMWRGVPASAILLEEQSRSTEENAIFSRPIIEANGWETVLLVSDGYHLFRAEILFRTRGIPVLLSPVSKEEMQRRDSYVRAVTREITALHWQVFKDLLGLPFTHFP
ncbi:MAG: YdcF family protein [Anaerolineae bacterium]|nr:YdcF family protein [Anaerolineae bacterium]